MAISKKQKELDKIKWEKSQQLGYDACGTFDYCVKCDKTKENPCEKAFNAFNKKPVAKKPAKKEVAVTAVKKPIAKKPVAKKMAKPVAKKK